MTVVTQTPERVLARIRKLLAVAEHPATDPTEADTYLSRALSLMAKYGVERALLEEAGRGGAAGRDGVDVTEIELRAPYRVEKGLLLNVVAVALRCRVVMQRRPCPGGGHDQLAKVVGFASDRERVALLFASLVVQMFGALRRAPVPWGVPAVTFRKSFCHGYTMRIRERLDAAERRAEREATAPRGGAALVLRDRARRVDARVAELFPGLRTGRPYRRRAEGIDAGAAAATRADLGDARLGTPARARLPGREGPGSP